ncbi:hypothetical protein AAHE18_19G140600 [Arachis hypogaea]
MTFPSASCFRTYPHFPLAVNPFYPLTGILTPFHTFQCSLHLTMLLKPIRAPHSSLGPTPSCPAQGTLCITFHGHHHVSAIFDQASHVLRRHRDLQPANSLQFIRPSTRRSLTTTMNQPRPIPFASIRRDTQPISPLRAAESPLPSTEPHRELIGSPRRCPSSHCLAGTNPREVA